MPISLEDIPLQKAASRNYKYLTGIDHFRSYVKILPDSCEIPCLSSAADATRIMMKLKKNVIN